jgi:hypothetical protein
VKKLKLVPVDNEFLHNFSSFKGYFDFDESTLVRSGSEARFFFLLCDKALRLRGLILAPGDKSTPPLRWMRIGIFHLQLEISEFGERNGQPKSLRDAVNYLKIYSRHIIEIV